MSTKSNNASPSPDFSQINRKSGSKTAKIYIAQISQQFKHGYKRTRTTMGSGKTEAIPNRHLQKRM
ncbi:hypothetical protein [Dolichospermum flos-aquae]|uniref:Uncharacterized protein n=1 Tax=Dolichospermum flos-aquae CCAP 1403/13F TaxID=315271 RepID=A0A6H2BX17_DOLFA|nr:hypothetical protein [Dolichospermum flos-aquae]QJB44122.1 hypothetical protein HGD76_07885 [Dolichospermum flos-aquae CCAP 1403/13F]